MADDGGIAGAAGPRLRVIVADDEPDIRLLTRQFLERDGRMQVVGEAPDGAAAIDLVRELRAGGVVLDLNMPVLDGRRAAEVISLETPETAVVMFTSMVTDDLPHPMVLKASTGWPERLVANLIGVALRFGVDWPRWERRLTERTS